MSELNNNQAAANSSSPLPILPAKRRRGRPRKDGSVSDKLISSQSPEETNKIIQQPAVEKSSDNANDMLGKMVSGVIDGCFDAGYFLTVRVGNNSTLLRGLVFQPGRFSPITPATDVVPQAKMFQRTEIPVPVLDLQDQSNGIIPQSDKPAASEQVLHTKPIIFSTSLETSGVMIPQSGSDSVSVSVPALSNMPRSNSAMAPMNLYEKLQPPLENLRMVEQDEVMQVFEISNAMISQNQEAVESKMESPNHDQQTDEDNKSVSQEQPQSESNNTNFDEFNHQSLALGNTNTQALPPELINNSGANAVDFMMGNPSAPKNDASNNDSLKKENVKLEQYPGRLETQIFNSASCTLPDFRFNHGNPSNTPENEHR